MALPLSVYATPGVRARGLDRLLPADHPKYAGLQLAFVANTPSMRDVSPPCFGFLTVKNRKAGGGKLERGAFQGGQGDRQGQLWRARADVVEVRAVAGRCFRALPGVRQAA